MHNAIYRGAIDHQILDDRKGANAKGLDRDRFSVAKLSHVKLTDCCGMIGTVRFSVNGERAGSANALAAIGVERDWLLAASEQNFVQNVEHLEKRGVRRNVAHAVINEFTGCLCIRLAPDSQVKVHC